ncbi:MAG: 2-oxoglutarate dehydrogenase E1 component [Gammaproteobacteria bacterium]|nr:2-oxoglutarate dehydrogenase E1 component [Gammaproteobacteria bacterium]
MSQSMAEQSSTTMLYGGNAAFVEDLYERFLADPSAVDPAWREYFAKLAAGATGEVAHGPLRERLAEAAKAPRAAAALAAPSVDSEKQAAVSRLIQVYANRGHLIAKLDPLGLQSPTRPHVLDLDYFGLSEADLESQFYTGSRTPDLPARMKLKDILRDLQTIYTGTIGAEFAHVSNTEERLWLQDQFQSQRMTRRFGADEKRNILWQLTAAEGLERYLHTKYVGQKRFSLEGGESLMPLLDDLVQQGGVAGVEETIIGMAHRGRLNVLINLLGKSPKDLFLEFEGQYDTINLRGSGDVKYHKGFSADLKTPAGNVHVALAFNPSHLEIVDAVVEGSTRARQERRGDGEGRRVLPVLIHGDAAFAGQGVVMETLQLSQARGFYTGGTVHLIINNQVGFTTSDPRDARSTLYCSDVAKMIEAPILHVNADDPEAVCFVARFALEYRMRFHKDVVIDLVCYRRHGHNEADEPSATQPLMYQTIRAKPTARQIYADRLIAEGLIGATDATAMVEQYRNGLDQGQPQARAALGMIGNQYTVDWSQYLGADWAEPVKTGIDLPRLRALGRQITSYPQDWKLHPRVLAIMQAREKMIAGEQELDWGCAENLAYASLLQDGYPIRLTGQDSGRGTFFHRHAVLHDQASGRRYLPLQHLADEQPKFTVTDSVLSEEAVLAFEYGFSTTEPHCLTIWEGQFGDFVNGAQVVIDQFISSGEAKWGRLSGLTLFLPHGYEGQGPEHSSARLERFLQLCAEYNMQVCVPSTPAQLFHMLRRQMVRALRKPLVVMMPKSLLRHPLSVSKLQDLARGGFRNLIDEVDDLKASAVTRVVFCSGKVYFDLLKARREAKIDQVALVRIEQLYPFPSDEYEAIVRKYANAREIVWCQEEPQNQGGWYQIRHRLQAKLGSKHELLYAGRAGAAAPATGIPALHDQQQKNLVTAALQGVPPEETAQHTMRLTAKKSRTGS